MKKLLIMLIGVLSSLASKGQYDCDYTTNNNPTPVACGNLIDYMPANPNDTVKIPVNFIFFTNGINGQYDTVTSSTCKSILQRINSRWMNLRPTWNVPPDTPGFWHNTQIQFYLKSISHKIDTQYAKPNGIKYHNFQVVDDMAINIVFNVNDNIGSAGAALHTGNIIFACEKSNSKDTSFNIFDKAYRDMLSHELGHIFGLYHTSEKNSQTVYNYNPIGVAPQNYVYPNPPVDDFWLEGLSSWGVASNDSVMNPGDTVQPTNNIMGYNWGFRRFFSPKQIQKMHHTMKTSHVVAKFSGFCTVGSSQNLSTGTYSGMMFPPGNLIIGHGEHVTMTGCVYMRPNCRIIIEPGGKLSLNGAKITQSCGQMWKGIEVWSDPGAAQALSYPNPSLPIAKVGILEVNNSTIQHALIAVNVGKFSPTGAFISQTGGGVVQSQNSSYLNNRIGVNFNNFLLLKVSAGANLSYFRLDSFVINLEYIGATVPSAGININQTNKIRIEGCEFIDIVLAQMTGIRVTNGSVLVKNYCSLPSSSGCIGANKTNLFKGLKYGISITGWLMNNPSIIDGAIFDQFFYAPIDISYGGIYIQNNYGTQIVDCEFRLFPNALSQNKYGIYMHNCDAYVIENNLFRGLTSDPPKTSGLIIHNSGQNSNLVYNNSFQHLHQAIWAQNINYDNNTGLGLRMTCNDFNSCRFNIGVQSQNLASLSPPGTQVAGVAVVQGVAKTNQSSDLVRNYYNSFQNICNAENRYYVKTDNPFQITTHGNFNSGDHQPAPQPSCSDSSEVRYQNDQNPAPSAKAAYCIANTYNSISNSALVDSVTSIREDISAKSLIYNGKLDGGSTFVLLNLIVSSTNPISLRDTLTGKHFLSDTVLVKYLNLIGNNASLFDPIFIKNAPVSSVVWREVVAGDFNSITMSLYDSLQFQHHLSDREFATSVIQLAKSQRGLIYNELTRRSLLDSVPQYDSIKQLYSRGEIPQSELKLFDLALTTGNYEEAETILNNMISNNIHPILTPALSKIYLLETDTSYLETLKVDTTFKNYLLENLDSNDPYREGYFKALLDIVYESQQNELVLVPDETFARPANTDDELTSIKNSSEQEYFSVYPNPTSDFVIIKSNTNRPFDLIISSLSGQKIICASCENDCKINTNHLMNGLYFLNLYEGKRQVGNGKLVIIR